MPGRALNWIAKASKDKNALALLGTLLLGAYLRLWQINHLFNVVHDYDEGAHSLGARFISQGLVPYQDFTLVHPPLYDYLLAGFYKVFGYSFLDGRYISIALSLACIVLIYLIGKKLYHPTAGIFAAALFAVSPDMVYLGRRVVIEPLGIFLILLAVYFAVDFIQKGKQNKALLCGLFLGLALAAKYLFIPAVVAIILAVAFLSMGKRFWRVLKTLGRPALWGMYLCFAAVFYFLLLLLKWAWNLDIPIPFLDPMYLSWVDVAVAVVVFLLPLVISIWMLERNIHFKQWWLGLWELRRNRGLWLLLGGTVLGFILITGFFWVKMPQEFFYQTVLLQQNRPPSEFPSLVSIIRTMPFAMSFLSLAFLPILFSIPLLFVLLNKKDFSKSECFLAVGLVVSLILCQGFHPVPRYYVSIFPFLLVGIAQLVPPLDAKMLTKQFATFTARFKVSLAVVLTIFVFFATMSLILLTNYTGYDVVSARTLASDEEVVYKETLDYLEGAGAEKVYAANPIFPTLSAELESTLAFDTFSLLWLEEKPPAEIIEEAKEEGVDYIILDPWVDWWVGSYRDEAREFAQEVRRNARLVMVVEPDSPCHTEIYLLGAEAEGIFNGDFAQWVPTDEKSLPLGWQAITIAGDGDEADIEHTTIAGADCIGFTIYEDGVWEENFDSTYAGVYQEIPFPESTLKIQAFPTANTVTTGRFVLGGGIHFADKHGHALIIGFSGEVDEDTTTSYQEGDRVLAVKKAQLNQWSEYTIDLAGYWEEAGWWQPDDVEIYLLASTYYSEPGHYALYVAEVEAAR
jgi:4-amino-4-deoxy-L-arabinose transferase-like glycosyltransferase